MIEHDLLPYEHVFRQPDFEYTINFDLTRFVGAQLLEIEDSDGMPISGVFIPIKMNNLFIPERTRRVWANLNMKKYDLTYWPRTHYLTPNWPREHFEWLSKLGYSWRHDIKLGSAFRYNLNSDPKMNPKQRYER